MSTFKLMNYAWSDNPREVDYTFPDSWDVNVYHIAGWQRPELTASQIKDAIAVPVGSPRIKDMAKGKTKVCILFDDLTRGTPAYLIAPHIIAELHEAGIPDNSIEFMCATGTHQAWDRSLLAKKIGNDIVKNYKVYNHAAFMNVTPLGTTSYGTKVEINAEVMSCDLKIAIGGCVPHGMFGFGSGGKIIMPGVSSYASVRMHHLETHNRWRDTVKKVFEDTKGVYEGNTRAKDAIEIARMAGLNFSVNCILNEKARIVAIFAGEVEKAHFSAVDFGREHYAMPDIRDNDIVVSNAYGKANEANIAMGSSFMAIKRTGGTSITVANCHLGQVAHFLYGNGLGFGGHGHGIPPWVNHCVWYSEFKDAKTFNIWPTKDLNRVSLIDRWSEVIEMLKKWHGDKAKVAIFPDGSTQYVKQPESDERLREILAKE